MRGIKWGGVCGIKYGVCASKWGGGRCVGVDVSCGWGRGCVKWGERNARLLESTAGQFSI